MRKWYPAVLIAGTFIFSAALYPRLPDRVATHWGIGGQQNGWSNRAVGAFLLPAILVVLWGLLRWLPRIDPRRENYAMFQSRYDLVVNVILTLLVGLHLMVFAVALGWPIPG